MRLFNPALLVLCVGSVQAVGNWMSLFDDKTVASFLDEQEESSNEDRRLDSDVGKFGDTCGNRNPCEEGNECTTVGVRGRCVPLSCLQSELKDIDLGSYKETIFANAGVTESEFLDAAKGSDRNSFMQTDTFSSVRESLDAQAQVLDATVGAAMMSCVGKSWTPRNNETNNGRTTYLGLQIEAGCLADGQFNYVSAGNPNDTRDRINYYRGCFGAEAGLGAEIGLMYGIAFTPQIGDMATCAFFGDIDGGLFAAAGFAIGIGFNGVVFLEFNGGGGFGFGLGGHFCGTLPVDDVPI